MTRLHRIFHSVLVLLLLLPLGGCAVSSTTTTTTAPRPDYLSDNVPDGFEVTTKFIPEDYFLMDYSNISYIPSTGVFCFDYEIEVVAAHLEAFVLQLVLPNAYHRRYRTMVSEDISGGRVFVGSYCSTRLLNGENYEIRIYGTTADQLYGTFSGFNVFAFSTPPIDTHYTGYTAEVYGIQDRIEWVVFDPNRTLDQLILRITRATTNEVVYELVVFVTPENYQCWQGHCVIFSYDQEDVPTIAGEDYFIELFVTGYNGIENLEDYPLMMQLRSY
jgi:hypothetical protein